MGRRERGANAAAGGQAARRPPIAEADAAAIFAEPAFKVLFELECGAGTATVWTSDLTHDYVTINADYRT